VNSEGKRRCERRMRRGIEGVRGENGGGEWDLGGGEGRREGGRRRRGREVGGRWVGKRVRCGRVRGGGGSEGGGREGRVK